MCARSDRIFSFFFVSSSKCATSLYNLRCMWGLWFVVWGFIICGAFAVCGLEFEVFRSGA